MDKPELRRHYLGLRDRADPLDRAAWSARICQRVAGFGALRGVRTVAAFWPLGSEVDLRPLMASQPDWTFYFPRIVARSPPALAWGTRPLAPGAWGLQEPPLAPFAAPPVQLVLVPGLAFADDGHRLGYGKGFYDTVLAGLAPEVVTLGTGFRLQRCPGLPTGPGDFPVQALVDEEGLTWIASPGVARPVLP